MLLEIFRLQVSLPVFVWVNKELKGEKCNCVWRDCAKQVLVSLSTLLKSMSVSPEFYKEEGVWGRCS